MEDDTRPIYPPSVAATATTHNTRTGNGSDGTEYTGHRNSLERAFPFVGGKTDHSASKAAAPAQKTSTTPTITADDFGAEPSRPTYERPRPSFDRLRSSMDRVRPSFEASQDFSSAAYLTRVESSQSGKLPTLASSRTKDVTKNLSSSASQEQLRR